MKTIFSRLIGSSNVDGPSRSDSGLRTAASRRSRRSAFTLVELLVVITIMAMLLALLGGGIRRSITNAKKRRAATERKAVCSAILTFWHDEGKPPIETKKGFPVYIYGEKPSDDVLRKRNITRYKHDPSVEPVLEPLQNPSHKLNNLNKAYLNEKDVNTGKEPSIKTIIIDLSSKNATVE